MAPAPALVPRPVETADPTATMGPRIAPRRSAEFRFTSLDPREEVGRGRTLSTTVTTSFLIHGVLVLALVLIPLFLHETLPEPGEAVRAFFVSPTDVAPPPPPPPPPAAASAAARVAKPVVHSAPIDTSRLIAPIEVPDQIKPEQSLDLGVEGGVPGGVEGGVPGGVVGGIVGGLPAAPPPPAKVVRIGGNVVAPKPIKQVSPVYPQLAAAARITGTVVIEAHVGTDGRVLTADVMRGVPLLNDAAVTAVRQWRYKPLLLNGVPTEFILNVTVTFNLSGVS
jgi:periplasmic protein TonB